MIQQNFALPKSTLISHGSRLETVELYSKYKAKTGKKTCGFPKINIFQQISCVLWDPQNWFENSKKIPTQFNSTLSPLPDCSPP